jgi:hypothetical protein
VAQIPQKKLRLVPLQIRNFWSAVSIARSGFGGETAMIVFSYLWYFWRNLRLPDFGLMARRQSMTLMSRRAPIALVDIVTTAIHGWDVCWLDLELLRDCPMSYLLNYLETWPLAHRLLLVRSHSLCTGLTMRLAFASRANYQLLMTEGSIYIHRGRHVTALLASIEIDLFQANRIRYTLHVIFI